jgi:hypothetical protein
MDIPRLGKLHIVADVQPTSCRGEEGLNYDLANPISTDRWKSRKLGNLQKAPLSYTGLAAGREPGSDPSRCTCTRAEAGVIHGNRTPIAPLARHDSVGAFRHGSGAKRDDNRIGGSVRRPRRFLPGRGAARLQHSHPGNGVSR